MTNIIKKYRIYCKTNSRFEFIWSTTAPETCPIDVNHSVNLGSVSDIGELVSRKIDISHSPFQIRQRSVVVDTSMGDVTITLPPASRSKNGTLVVIKNIASNKVIINAYTGDLIDEVSSLTLNTMFSFFEFKSNGTIWIMQITSGSYVPDEVEMLLPTTFLKGDIISDDGEGAIVLVADIDKKVLMTNSMTSSGLEWSFTANTASNTGVAGIGVFKRKNNDDLEFKNISSASTKLTVVDNILKSQIDLDIVESSILHDNLAGTGYYAHMAIDTHINDITANPHFITANMLGLGNVENLKMNLKALTDPSVNDHIYDIGSVWLNTSTDRAFICLDNIEGFAVWKPTTLNSTSDLPEGSQLFYTDDRVDERVNLKIGYANGIASLDSGGKVPSSQLSLSNVIYVGTWNASTNTPTLSDGSGSQGEYYVVSVAGNTTINGVLDWSIGDWIIRNKSVWEKSDHSESVTSVSGKNGVVTLVSADIMDLSTSQVPEGNGRYYTDARVSANTDVSTNTIHVTSIGNSHGLVLSDLETIGICKDELNAINGPTVNDDLNSNFSIGSKWVNTINKSAFICMDATNGIASWSQLVGPGSGEVNTATNIGTTGRNIFKQKTGVNFEFRSINAASTKVTVVSDTHNNEIDIDIVEANIVHDNLSGSGTNSHAQIDTHIKNISSNPHAINLTMLGIDNVRNTKVNLVATIGPTVDNDSTEGYSVNSVWIDITAKLAYVCVDATATNAVWHQTTLSDTDDLSEGNVNKFYTDARADTRITMKKGVANGLATLNGTGKIPASQLSLSNVVYIGTWNANTNIPTLVNSTGTQGEYLVVNVAGSTSLDGITDWNIGDWVIFNGTVYEKADHTDSVTSVAGKQGAVLLDTDDITEASNMFFTNARVNANTNVITNTIHAASSTNPHSVTKSDILLGNVQNILSNFSATTAPTTTDDFDTGYSIGSIWILNDVIYTLVDSTPMAAVWVSSSEPAATQIWVMRQEEDIGNNGGTFTTGSWQERTLNTIHVNGGTKLSLLNNHFTLQKGRYFVDIMVPGYDCGKHRTQLYNVTDMVIVESGPTIGAETGVLSMASLVTQVIVTNTDKTFSVRHRCTQTKTSDGFGIASGWATEIYSCVKVTYLGPHN